MKIEAGKYYKTRDGRKVGPMAKTKWPKIMRGCIFLFNKSDGTHGDRDDSNPVIFNDPNLDLIAEWTDNPQPVLSGTSIDAIAIESLKFHMDQDMEPLEYEAFRVVLRYYGVVV